MEGLTDLDYIYQGQNKSRLVSIDDLMSEVNNKLTDMLTKGSHHNNLSIIHIVQNLFFSNKEQRTFSLNSHS